MKTMVSVVLSYDEEIRQWGAWVSGISAYGVGDSTGAALEDLKKALALHIEVVGKKKFLEQLAPPSQSISVPLNELVEVA